MFVGQVSLRFDTCSAANFESSLACRRKYDAFEFHGFNLVSEFSIWDETAIHELADENTELFAKFRQARKLPRERNEST